MDWANVQVMRRTHAPLMNGLGVNGKLVADQLGHSLDVNQTCTCKRRSRIGCRQSINWKKASN
jgi:hypothetical protein